MSIGVEMHWDPADSKIVSCYEGYTDVNWASIVL